MYEIIDPTAAPYRSICYITCEWSDGKSVRASGVVVGPNDVLTAHHVVFDPQRGYATRITISPAADTLPFATPYGTWSDVTSIDARSASWDLDGDGLMWDYESQYDMALLGLSSRLGDITGWLTASTWSGENSATFAGYPVRGTGLMAEDFYTVPQRPSAVFVTEGALGPGASGGPMLQATANGCELVGILSAGDIWLTESTYAGFFGAGNYLWLLGAIAANDGPSASPPGYGLRPVMEGTPGTASDDTLTGTDNDDTFLGSWGMDTLDGQEGTDTMMYAGPRSSYSLSWAEGDTLVAQDTLDPSHGIDRLRHFERIVFADLTVNLAIGDEAAGLPAADLQLLIELYVAFFNRVPEADGLAHWIAQAQAGMSMPRMADAFYAAALLYPEQTGYNAGMSHADFVNTIYRNTLGRADGADTEGLDFWTQALSSGAESRGSLVRTILLVAHGFKGHATWGWVADLLDNKAETAHDFAVTKGLNYNTPQASIAATQAIAAAVTPHSDIGAIELIGVSDGFVT